MSRTGVVSEKTVYKMNRNIDSELGYAVESPYLEAVLDLQQAVDSVDFGPFRPGDQSVLVWQGADSRRLFFDTCLEALHFADSLALRTADSTGMAADQGAFHVQYPVLDEWADNFSTDRFNEAAMESMLRHALDRFFFVEDSDDSIVEHIDRWKCGIRWHQQIRYRLLINASSQHLDYFEARLSRILSTFFVATWNKSFDKLNIEECAYFEGIVSNILNNTEVFKGMDSAKVKALQSATVISLECMSSNNLAAIVKKILINFWAKDNFDVLQGKFISYAANDIISLIIDLQRKFDVMDDESSRKVLRNICIE